MKKLIVGVVFLIVLAALAVWVTKKDSSNTMRGDLSNFSVEDTASIKRIVLRDETGNFVNLERSESEWTLNDEFKARPDAITILLTTIKKLAVKAPISQVQMNTVLKTIISNHTLVEIYTNDGLLKSFYVGGPDKEHTGTFMLMKGSQRPFLMHMEGFHGFLTPRFFTNVLEWRDRGVFEYKASNIQNITVEYPESPANNFKIDATGDHQYSVFTGANWDPAARIDSLMLSAYIAQYKMIHYESFEETKSEAFIDSVQQSAPIFKITVADKSGASKFAEGFKKPIRDGYDPVGNEIEFDLDRLYLRINGGEMVVAQYAIFDKLTKGIAFINNR